jgi:hypothetical protein
LFAQGGAGSSKNIREFQTILLCFSLGAWRDVAPAGFASANGAASAMTPGREIVIAGDGPARPNRGQDRGPRPQIHGRGTSTDDFSGQMAAGLSEVGAGGAKGAGGRDAEGDAVGKAHFQQDLAAKTVLQD